MATRIEHRFVFDSEFFEETLKDDSELQYKLSYITSKATHNKKKQNLISEKSRNLIIENNEGISLEVLRYFLNRIEPIDIIESIDEEVTRTLKYAIEVTYSWPFRVILFTSEAKVEEYKNNPHYKNNKAISFEAKEDAKATIEYWYGKCREERLGSCD